MHFHITNMSSVIFDPFRASWAVRTSDLCVIGSVQMASVYVFTVGVLYKPAAQCSVETNVKTTCQIDTVYKFLHLLRLRPWLDMVDPSCVYTVWEEGHCRLQRGASISEYFIASDHMQYPNNPHQMD